MNTQQKQDIQDFSETFSLASDLENATFLITGATGLIGSTLVRCLVSLKQNIRIIAPVRNVDKAKRTFDGIDNEICFVPYDIDTFDYSGIAPVDYVVHCAAPTSSKYFVEHAVETINAICKGTSFILEHVKKHPIKSMVYLSSLEVYGSISDDSTFVTENIQGYLDPTDVRSSYPMAKRTMENLCVSYAREYNVPVKIARLTQTTGAGIAGDDNRVIAQFARLTADGKDIVLHTTGEAARPYCYTTDCISAILYILLKGKSGEAYNVANEDTYISARGMAEFLQKNFNPKISVRVELNNNMGYAPVTKIRLSSEKLRSLGWEPKYGLKEIFEKLCCFIKR